MAELWGSRAGTGGIDEFDNELRRHYAIAWSQESTGVTGLKLDIAGRKMKICLQPGARGSVSRMRKRCAMADHMTKRIRRHLDTMQFETSIRAQVRRSRCARAPAFGYRW